MTDQRNLFLKRHNDKHRTQQIRRVDDFDFLFEFFLLFFLLLLLLLFFRFFSSSSLFLSIVFFFCFFCSLFSLLPFVFFNRRGSFAVGAVVGAPGDGGGGDDNWTGRSLLFFGILS